MRLEATGRSLQVPLRNLNVAPAAKLEEREETEESLRCLPAGHQWSHKEKLHGLSLLTGISSFMLSRLYLLML